MPNSHEIFSDGPDNLVRLQVANMNNALSNSHTRVPPEVAAQPLDHQSAGGQSNVFGNGHIGIEFLIAGFDRIQVYLDNFRGQHFLANDR